MITPLEMANSYKTTMPTLKRTQKTIIQMFVSSENSTREHLCQFDILSELTFVNTIIDMEVVAKMWKQGNVEIRVLYVAL